MPEVSARDLRRLQALEVRLEKATEDRKALTAARRELRSTLAERERRIRALQRERGSLNDQLAALLAENRTLADRLDEITADHERLETASAELRTKLEGAESELKNAQAALATAQSKLTEVQTDQQQLASQLKIANEQLAGKGITPVLPAEQVAKLVDSFVGALDRGLPDLVVRDGEIRLQVAFAQVGRTTGFVVPSPGAPPEVRENLHDVAVRFDRSVELPGTERS